MTSATGTIASVAAGRPHPGEPRLDALDIFADVPAVLYANARRCEYRHGDAILSAGAAPDRLIILVRGHVDIVEGDVQIASRAAGRLVGELAFIDAHPRSASVIARGAVVTNELLGSDVEALLGNLAFLRNLTRELSWKLREATSERAWRYRTEETLFGTFRSHASPELLQDLLRTDDLGTPRRAEAVALFADIRDFTGKSLTMSPEALASDLGCFLDLAVSVVHKHGGMVDKFIGDSVMALWGYSPRPDDPERAVACAHDLVERAASLTIDGEPMRIGVGAELGVVTLGVVGSEGKRQFTAIGPAVNLAARLQAETKLLGVAVCLGPELVSRLPEGARARLRPAVSRDIRGVGQVDVWSAAVEE